MIHPQRLSAYISSRICMSNTEYIIKEILDKMSVEQRKEIRELLWNNSREMLRINASKKHY